MGCRVHIKTSALAHLLNYEVEWAEILQENGEPAGRAYLRDADEKGLVRFREGCGSSWLTKFRLGKGRNTVLMYGDVVPKIRSGYGVTPQLDLSTIDMSLSLDGDDKPNSALFKTEIIEIKPMESPIGKLFDLDMRFRDDDDELPLYGENHD